MIEQLWWAPGCHTSLPVACRALGYPEQRAIHCHIPLLLASSCFPAKKIENSLCAYQDLMVSIPGNASVNGRRLAIGCSSTVLSAGGKAHPTGATSSYLQKWQLLRHFLPCTRAVTLLFACAFFFLHTPTYCLQFQPVSIHSIEASLTTFKDTFIKITNNEIFLLECFLQSHVAHTRFLQCFL